MAIFDTELTPYLGAIGVFLCTFYLVRRRKKENFPPGPTGLPLLGYIPFIGKYPPRTYMKLAEKYGPVLSVTIGGEDWVVLNDYEAVHEALVKQGDAFSGRPQLFVFKRLTQGYGIVFRDFDENFKRQRKFALHTLRGFGVGKRSLEDKITEEIGYFTELIESKNGESFDCQTPLSTSVSNVTCSIAMGSRFSYDDETFRYMIKILNRGFGDKKQAKLTFIVIFAPILRWIPPFSGAYKILLDDVDSVTDILRGIIEEHRKTFDADNIRDFIDAYLYEMEKRGENDKSFKEIQLLQTMRDFFLAGTETTSSTLRWSVLCFAHFSEIQQKVANEIKKVVGDGVPSTKVREEMPYTCAFIHELTRHKPIAPLAVPHITTKDAVLRGYDIPKGTPISPNLYAVNHDPKYFKDPNEFTPERFINEDGVFVPCKQVIPFSVGPRYCLGEQLAKMELFLFITNIIQKFEIVPDPSKPLPSFDDAISGFAEVAHQFEVSFKSRK